MNPETSTPENSKATPAPEAAPPVETEAAVLAQDEPKGGSKKWLLLVGGVGAAAGVGVAVSGANEDEGSAQQTQSFSGSITGTDNYHVHTVVTASDGVVSARVSRLDDGSYGAGTRDFRLWGGGSTTGWAPLSSGASISVHCPAGPVDLEVFMSRAGTLGYTIEVTYLR